MVNIATTVEHTHVAQNTLSTLTVIVVCSIRSFLGVGSITAEFCPQATNSGRPCPSHGHNPTAHSRLRPEHTHQHPTLSIVLPPRPLQSWPVSNIILPFCAFFSRKSGPRDTTRRARDSHHKSPTDTIFHPYPSSTLSETPISSPTTISRHAEANAIVTGPSGHASWPTEATCALSSPGVISRSDLVVLALIGDTVSLRRGNRSRSACECTCQISARGDC